MALVDYDSDSDIESQWIEQRLITNHQTVDAAKKRKFDSADSTVGARATKLPPLPSSFHSLYATNVRSSTNDDPSLHGGRKRQIPHVAGNWPTHVYLEWYPSLSELGDLEHAISKVRTATKLVDGSSTSDKIHSLLKSDLGVWLPLHISLSAPLVLRGDQRPIFEDALEGALKRAAVHPFKLICTGLDWVSNLERTRSFLVMRLGVPEQDELNKLLRLCNESAERFGLPLLYDTHDMEHKEKGPAEQEPRVRAFARNPSPFHISIAWQLFQQAQQDINVDDIKNLAIKIDALKIKIGNTIKEVPL